MNANTRKSLRSRVKRIFHRASSRFRALRSGCRAPPRETVAEHCARLGSRSGSYELVHPPESFDNPLPLNVRSRNELPDDRGWWGFSFRDVPERRSDETFIATIPHAHIAWYQDPRKRNDFYPAILTRDGHALDLREIRFRPGHATALRRLRPPVRVPGATWVLERVYHNHSHWLTAHLPKLLLLSQRNGLEDVLLPPAHMRTPAMDDSLRMLDMDPGRFRTFAPRRSLEVGQLTLVGTDRYRPQLLRLVARALTLEETPPPNRRIYISRAGASRRRLLNEEALWSVLEGAGFERVLMEQLPFPQQVRLMRETAVLWAPHGAGLTNMMFCPPGAHVVEIADLGFPNPNFYALAAALGHHYWLLPGAGVGEDHPLERDMQVDIDAAHKVLEQLVKQLSRLPGR